VAQTAPVAVQATPAPAEKSSRGGKSASSSSKGGKKGQSVKVVEGTPPPQQAPQPTPDKETIRKGAARLKQQLSVERIPSDLLSRYVGRWKGDFWVYAPTGELQESKACAIEYKMGDRNTLQMETYYVDRISKQWIVAETATYQNNGDSVLVTIKKPDGKIATQTGHYNDGQLFLVSNIKDGIESYRERIDGKRLLVDGFGVYGGKDSHVFIGRLLRER